MVNAMLPARDVIVTHHLTVICASITRIEISMANVSVRTAGITQIAIFATYSQEIAALSVKITNVQKVP